jgi:hypothetical protein
MNDMSAALEQIATLAKFEASQEFADAKAQFEKQLLDAKISRDDALRRCAAAEEQATAALTALGSLRLAVQSALEA